MTRYQIALKEAEKILGEDSINEEVSPQVKSLLQTKDNLQKRLDAIDKQRKPIVLQIQEINKKLTLLGQDITA